VAFAAVHATVVDVATDARLEHPLRDFDRKHVVLARKPGADAFGEHAERAVNRSLNDDLRSYGRCLLGGSLSAHAHVFSSRRSSTAVL
jgi:hypothetical protein